MNDRLKYRIYDTKEKIMHNTDFVVTSTGYAAKIYYIFNNVCHFKQTDFELDKNCIVMQCTGLKDKNGKLIYEGDILYIKSCGMKCVIEWHKTSYRLMVHILGSDDIVDFDEILNEKRECPFEVIGNIYKNEDLLNAT